MPIRMRPAPGRARYFPPHAVDQPRIDTLPGGCVRHGKSQYGLKWVGHHRYFQPGRFYRLDGRVPDGDHITNRVGPVGIADTQADFVHPRRGIFVLGVFFRARRAVVEIPVPFGRLVDGQVGEVDVEGRKSIPELPAEVRCRQVVQPQGIAGRAVELLPVPFE